MEKPLLEITNKIEKKSRETRISANLSVLTIIIIVGIMIFIFYSPSKMEISINGDSNTLKLDWVVELAPIVAKLSSIFLAIYLVQVLVGIARYKYRIADHLDFISLSIQISSNDPDKLGSVIASISSSHIDFGKTPNSVPEKGLELAKEAIAKIPLKPT